MTSIMTSRARHPKVHRCCRPDVDHPLEEKVATGYSQLPSGSIQPPDQRDRRGGQLFFSKDARPNYFSGSDGGCYSGLLGGGLGGRPVGTLPETWLVKLGVSAGPVYLEE